MRKITIGFIIVVILIGVLLVASYAYISSTFTGDKWEYRTLTVLDTEQQPPFDAPFITDYRENSRVNQLAEPVLLFSLLNEIGENGWEYVGSYGNDMIFKRKSGTRFFIGGDPAREN